jgi:hypothetical protein
MARASSFGSRGLFGLLFTLEYTKFSLPGQAFLDKLMKYLVKFSLLGHIPAIQE